MKNIYKYKFSIVVAIYNVEEYIEDCIQSVINQSIGFKENVQLILVNDGSCDNSELICKNYHKLYPKNIIYIKKENSGVSSARNEGMKYIEGKYMNFLDSDDRFELNALEKVYDFFEKFYEKTDVVAIPVHFFEGKCVSHILNYKFKATRCINLKEEYINIQLFANSVFIKSFFKDKFAFDENMKYAEDAKFVNMILLRLKTIGVVSDTKYWYRYRRNNSSALQKGVNLKEWYIDYIKTFSYELLEYSLKKYNYIDKFIQFTVIYDLQWRINNFSKARSILDDNEYEYFSNCLIKILKKIDFRIILEQNNFTKLKKFCVILLKVSNIAYLNRFIINHIIVLKKKRNNNEKKF